jgi:GNAT superfamily N-acetyltransferase
MTITVRIWPLDDCPANLQALLPTWRDACFPDPLPGIIWRTADSIQWVFAGGEPVSVLKIIDHTIRVDGQPVHVGGVAGVMTPPAQQGKGYGSASMRAAADFIRAECRASFGLLGCLPLTVPFYARLGWQTRDAEFTFTQPDGRSGLRFPWHDVPMILPLGDARWPAGDEIDFNGLPW